MTVGRNCPACKKALKRNNAPRIREYARAYYAKNRGKIQAQYKASREANPDRTRAWRKADYEKHRERRSAYGAEYRKAHADQFRAYMKAYSPTYRRKNPGLANAYWHKRRAVLLRCEGSHTPAEWEAVKRSFGDRCAEPGCNEKNVTKDHVVPLSRGGSNFAFNLQPLCGKHNSEKHDKLLTVSVSFFDRIAL
jgi:5-methylcytosine-specific restriction endonuclease McrA